MVEKRGAVAMIYDFDKVIDRRNTFAVKWDGINFFTDPMNEDTIPMMIADMDLPCPEPVVQAMHRVADNRIYGYSGENCNSRYADALCRWFRDRHGWQIKPEEVISSHGTFGALTHVALMKTKPGQGVILMNPVYGHFSQDVAKWGREVVFCHLLSDEIGYYTIDFAKLEALAADPNNTLLILCNPHNPVGRVWTKEELAKIGSICKKHGVLVISDEIHCDFAFPDHPHTPFVKACPEMQDRTVICTAPSKSFNLAGLQVSNIFVPGRELYAKVKGEMEVISYDSPNMLGAIACQAAYEGGEAWLDACKAYMRENLEFVRTFLAEHLPAIKLVEPEGTYFAWLDCSGLGMTKEELDDVIINKAKLWLDSGAIFGEVAAQFQRVVLACPRATLEEAMHRLEKAING